MNYLFYDIFQEIFSPENLKILWLEHNSEIDQISIKTSFPIRVIKTKKEAFSIELFLNSSLGSFYKPLGLIHFKKIILPNEFFLIGNEMNLQEFRLTTFKKEIDILIGAFSQTSYHEALKNQDITDFTANSMIYEHLVAFDGTIQCFFKNDSEPSELDNKPIAGFKAGTNGLMVFATNFSKQWFDMAQDYRLLEIYNQ